MAKVKGSPRMGSDPEPLQTFEAALARVADEKKPHVLLGNGFSRACRNDIFSYDSLFDRADFSSLSANAKKAFNALDTTDFEAVMRALRAAAALVRIYAPKREDLAKEMEADADGLREVLVAAISQNHPAWPGEIPPESFAACRQFLSRFERIYSLNYDLLLYWAVMQSEVGPALSGDDGFRTPEDGPGDYVVWEPYGQHQQNVFYLHGSLHVFDSETEIQKFTWVNTGVRLIEQIRSALASGRYPLFVAEGTSKQKLRKIRHSDYLSKAYRSFTESPRALFIYGHSLGASDQQVLRRIERSRIRQVFVSVYGDPRSDENKRLMTRARALSKARKDSNPLEVDFFDAATAAVWG